MTPQEIADAISMLTRELASINVMLEEDDDFNKKQLTKDKEIHESLIAFLKRYCEKSRYYIATDGVMWECNIQEDAE